MANGVIKGRRVMAERTDKPKSTLFQLIIRILTVHVIAVIIYVFILLIFVQLFGDNTSIIIASVVVPVMYLVMTYLEAWRCGFKDRSMIKAGRVTSDKFRGLKAAIISQIPGIILGILSLMGNDSAVVTSGVRYFFMSMAYEIQNFGGVWYILPAALPLLSVVPGYAMGLADKRLVNRILYTRNKAE